VDKGSENHGTLYMERQTEEAEHKMESSYFRLVTPCVCRRMWEEVMIIQLFNGL
jgi:hypothetical protein